MGRGQNLHELKVIRRIEVSRSPFVRIDLQPSPSRVISLLRGGGSPDAMLLEGSAD